MLTLAAELAERVLRPGFEVLDRMKGRDLVGVHYEPLYRFYPVEQDYCYVVTGDFVSTEEGTGIVHIAPAFGADDMEVGKKYDLPLIMTIGNDGKFRPEVTPWAGVFVKDADPAIQEELAGRGLLYKAGVYEHTYPFCWRCDSPLLYYAKETWYVRTSAYRDQLVGLNQQINWYPEHIKDGRFGNWLENNVDWALGRERYSGHAHPHLEERRAGQQLPGVHRLHRRVGGQGRPFVGGPGSPPSLCGQPDLARARWWDHAPGERSVRRLVRFWLHAHRPVALSLREP